MKQFESLFDRMDAWRHFPNYQLERRADLFFSLYLPEVLNEKLGYSIYPELIPEFPVRIGTIYQNKPIDKSYKIDYVALSEDFEKAVLVELKTDGLSRRNKQDDYLNASKVAGFSALTDGLLDIFKVTKAKPKYFHLLSQLESMGMLKIPDQLRAIMSSKSLVGFSSVCSRIENLAIEKVKKTSIVYVQPHGVGSDIINFEDFASVVRRHQDPVSQRFACSLIEWATVQAGKYHEECIDMSN